MAVLDNMSPQAMAAWEALTQSWGQPLTLTSAYRDPAYNASVGGARGSQHIHGNAFDVSTAGMSPEQRAALIQQARAAGFQGFGGYDNSLHFDVGPSRTWGSDYTGATTPDWLREALGSGGQTQISTSGVNTMAMNQQQPEGLLGFFGVQKQDPTATDQTALPFYQRDRFKNTMGNLAVALNEMRLNPSQAVPQIVQSRQEGRQQTRMDNRTIEWLRGQPNGERFAQLAEAVGAGPALQMYQEAIKGPEQTALMQNYEYALRQGMSPEEARQWVSSGTNITMGAGETAWDKGIGQYGVDTYVATQSAANSAIETLGNLQQMEVLMSDPNFRSGTGADALSSAAKIVELLGGNPAEVSSMEAFRAQVSNSVLSKLGGSLGAGFSDGDRRFIETTVPNLTNSVEGNRLIISIARNMANRQIEIGQLADQYVAQNGRLDAGWNAFIRNWANQNPLFPVNPDGTLSEDAQSYLGGQ